MESQLGRRCAAECILRLLEPQGRVPQLTKNRIDGRPERSDERCGERSRAMAGHTDIEDDGLRRAEVEQGPYVRPSASGRECK